ncbi:NAD-dependent epimerase/dehydratase family protein [Pseudopedobacter sp.]|uniref:NAD-dependent epimerase/dehydratase family protein n=1 Tax=Pseudopedobacter sp. TaxID=1936787 RepID=UPI00333E21B6
MILVTGATGFLGAELTRQLITKGYSVRCTKRENSNIPDILLPLSGSIEWVDADILDLANLEQAIEGIQQVYHCAAMVSFNRKNEDLLNEINVEGTANIVNLCLERDIRLVHVSSVAAIGNPKANEAASEKNVWDAYDKNGVYAISKYRGEMEVWRGIEEGLNAVIVNPSVIIGENIGKSGSGQIFNLVSKGLKYYTNGKIGLVDVKDVAGAMIALMESNIRGERYIVNAENYTYQRFFHEILVANEMQIKQKEIAKWKLILAAKVSVIGDMLLSNSAGLSADVVTAAYNQTEYSNQKIIDALDFEFEPISDSIVNTVRNLKG